ncbi:MAG: MBL fold metallo-hydrolase [Verrucomicrobiales bacterium]|jgi:L-ascorbate metabolism protein UlaG (beta-lactamase superfamily)|nr:MBL fold metallo-hydrolase [Verrucomicrobiales bacterium]
MRNLLPVLLLVGLAVALPGFAAPADMMRSGSNAVQPRPDDQSPPPAKEQKAPAADTAPVEQDGTDIRFYGHAFLYLTTSSGIRIALNPFPNDPNMGYTFPSGLPADVVLISAEAADLSANDGFSGLPQVFRSLTGLGVNNANGLQFRGVATYRDNAEQRNPRGNTAYVLELDRLVFCDLGAIGQVLDKRQIKEIGHVDVLFLPVGNPQLSVADLWKLVDQTGAKWIVPVMYRTPKSPFRDFRTLDDFLNAPESLKYEKTRLDGNDYLFNYKKLPKEPTLLLYQSP